VVAARRLSGDWRRTVLVAVVGVTVLFAVVLGPAVGSAYASAELADRSDRETTALRSVPDTSTANARTRSESAAATAARAQVREPGFGTRDGRLTYRNGTYAWSFPVVPDELRSRLTGSQRGAVYVAADGSGAPVVRETPFRNGLGGVWLGAYEYQAMLAEPTLQRQPATRVVFEHDGEAYIAESTVRHEWRFRAFPVPQPYAVPQPVGGHGVRPSERGRGRRAAGGTGGVPAVARPSGDRGARVPRRAGGRCARWGTRHAAAE